MEMSVPSHDHTMTKKEEKENVVLMYASVEVVLLSQIFEQPLQSIHIGSRVKIAL